MIVKNQSLLIAFDTESQTVSGAIVTQDLYEDDGTPITTRTKPLSEVELAATVASIDSALLAERDELNLQVESLLAQLAATKEQLPFNPRMIDPSAWYARLTMDNVLAITEAATTDPIANSFVVALKESRQLRRDDPTYQMSLDHPNAQAGIAYLSGHPIPIDAQGNTSTIAKPVFTAEEAAAMLADSRADEQ